MALLTYEQTRPWAKAIRAAVFTGKMPPWQADPHYGKFINDLSLAPGEKEKLIAWVDAGAKEGDPADAPKPIAFPEGWRIPKPDVVFEMPDEFEVPAKGVIDYQYIPVPTHFTEDKWVEMAEVRPGDRSVVHHAIVVVDTGTGANNEEYLAGYAPGSSPQIWKPGQARLIKAGATLVFQMHYATTGKASRDRTRIGLIFAKKPASERIVAMQVMDPEPGHSGGQRQLPGGRVAGDSQAGAPGGHARAHAPARKIVPVPRGLSQRRNRDPAGHSQVRFQLAALLLSGNTQTSSRWYAHRVHRVLRQLRQQPVQSRSHGSDPLGTADLG